MTEFSGYTDTDLVETNSDVFEFESAVSVSSGSYEEEDLYSSESDIATEFNSQTQSKTSLKHLDKEGPSVSYHSLGSSILLEDVLSESRPDSSNRPISGGQKTPQLSKQELIRQIHLRRHINELKKNVEEKENKVEECRIQLNHCHEHLNSLLAQESSLQFKVSDQEAEKGTTPSLGLTKSQLVKVRSEIASEQNVEINIQNELQRAELELSEARMAAGKFEDVETDLIQGEEAAKDLKMRQAVKRIQTENKLVVNVERAKKTQERTMAATLRDQEQQTKLVIEQARQAQVKGKQFLQETLDRRKKEDAMEGDRHRTHLDKRIKAMLSLKKNIESTQSTIQAQQLLKSESAKRQQSRDQRERERILLEGGNPDETFLRRQRVESFEINKETFLKRQNERQVEIVNRLLEEEKMLEKVEKKLSKSHWHGRQECPHPSKRLSSKKRRVKRAKRKDEGALVTSDNDKHTTPHTERGDTRFNTTNESSSEEDNQVEVEPIRSKSAGREESLAEPEIRGLWDKTKSTGVGGLARREKSKAEVEMMRQAMEKLKKSTVIKQVVAGREFKGQAFISKPSKVVFQDFELGKSYRKKVQLTNISYSFNYCKLVGVSDNLKDFVSIEFNPPGSMSAGLTCHMLVLFEPKLNEDITGHIEMLSQTGPFTISVECLTKKCLISAEKTLVDFGKVCLGETVRRQIFLSNKGALPTKFTFECKSQLPHSLQAQSESLTSEKNSVGHLSDKSMYSIMSNIETRPSRMDTLTVGGVEGGITKSAGDLSCVSQKSLSWADNVKADDRQILVNQDSVKNEVDQCAPTDMVDNEENPTSQDNFIGERIQVDIQGPIVESLPALPEHPPSIQVGRVTEGEIPPFSSCSVELVFSPELASDQSSDFVFTFSHPSVKPVTVSACGCGVDLPVWLERESMDMRVCMVDRLYQDTVVLHNRTPTALRVTFEVPSLLQPHLEVLPKYGVIQGNSSYNAQVKFTPRESILDGSCDKFLCDGGGLDLPVEVQVVDQSRPVAFSLLAQVTPSEITFDKNSIDFGSCTTHESVVATLQLTNTSLLLQSFGFVNLPAFVDVQPGDGFGEILPEETLMIDVIFSARKPREYTFELTIKTAMDSTYKIPCCGVGVLPALELSENAINFSATALNDTSTATITVHNPRLGRLNSAVIRGALLPQGPKMFEFVVPSEYPITICPQVGEISLGESVNVQVQFSPKLKPEAVKEESLRLATIEMVRQAEEAAIIEQEKIELEQQQISKKKGKKTDTKAAQKSALLSSSKNSLSSSNSKPLMSSDSSSSKVESTPEPDLPKEGSDMWWQAKYNLLTQFNDSCLQLFIPCFVSSETSDTNITTPSHRPEDTLYLEVTAPVVRPALVVESDGGRTHIDYDFVGTGDAKTKMISVKNVSDQVLCLEASALDPHGPFELRNALRELSPGKTTNLIIRFSPVNGGKFYEPLILHYGTSSTLTLKLAGTGIKPDVSLSLDGDCLDLGHTMVGDTVTGCLELKNNSSLSVRYKVTLESSLPKSAENRKKKGLPYCTTNFNGEPPFSCAVCQGVVNSDGGSSEVTVSFAPDHQSSAYTDTLYIDINGQYAYTVQLRARAWTNNMYLQSPEDESSTPLPVQLSTIESMSATIPVLDDQSSPPLLIVLHFIHHLGGSLETGLGSRLQNASDDGLKKNGGERKSKVNVESSAAKVTREIQVGCIKTPLVKKAAGDYSIEAIPSSNPQSKLFSINPMKSGVEAGGTKTVIFTFTPPKHSSTQTIEASTNMTLKGDSSQVYRLLLRGLACE